MADSNIGSLPQAVNLDDNSLLVAEQQGVAVKVTGAQFKEFGRQAVIGQVQSYVDQAEAAAEQATSAVSAVTDMTVEAHTSDTPTVTKTTKNGKFNLDFGLPKGEPGEAGPTGPQGPQGPRGATGKGLTILGYYGTEEALKAAVTDPEDGDAYGVGTEAPYDIYVFDGVSEDWKNNGPLSGGGGVIPENVVTAEGGASMSFPIDFGDGPHAITFVDEEEPPLTAADIVYENGTVEEAIDDLKSSVSNGKSLIASAITDKGVTTAQDATFAQMAQNIEQISGGGDTSDATATSFDILSPKTAYTATGKVQGTIPTLLGQTIVPGTSDQTIANGQYLGGTQVIKGDPNLTSNNIKSGVTLFGVEGALEPTFKATLTVMADTGAVVTATHSGGTSVSGLSQNGTVVLDLPLEGTWSVTAVRGVAQYNTVTLNVTSSYNASLTAEIHIEYFSTGTPLTHPRYGLSSATIGDYAIFHGYPFASNIVSYGDTYNKSLTHGYLENVSNTNQFGAATAIENYALFGGGGIENSSLGYIVGGSDSVDVYDKNLTKNTRTLSVGRHSLAAASVGGYALFGGGGYGASLNYSTVDVYSSTLTHTTAEDLILSRSVLAASSNDNYVLFGGGKGTTESDAVDAYNQDLTHSTPTFLSKKRKSLAAAKAGNYVLFCGGNGETGSGFSVDAYDLFLTRSTPEPLSDSRSNLTATTLNGYGLFGGGNYSKVVDVYDPYLTKTITTDLSIARELLSATAIGNYAIFAGGIFSSNKTPLNTVDVYKYI